jgi:sugar/nucleoside kinase (ribokinase family)
MHIWVLGNVNVDVLLGEVTPWPEPGTETILPHYQLRVGGALGNTALALHALGARASYLGSLGDDALGDWLDGELRRADCALTRVAAGTAVTAGLTHPGGERTFFTHLGHLQRYRVMAEELARMAPGDLCLLCGYFLLPEVRCEGPRLLQALEARGVTTLLDTGWPSEGFTDEVREEVAALLPHVDYFLPNREEVEGLCGLGLRDGLERLSSSVKGRVLVKLGAEGAGYMDGGSWRHVPAPEVEVVDTVGAGDTFNAGLLAALQRGCALSQAIRLAVEAASLAVASSPRRYPRWEEVGGELEPSR